MYSPAKIQVVAGLLVNGEEVLVAQRKMSDSGGGAWEFPGGKVESGETLEEALKREIREELGLEIKVIKQLDSHDVLTPTNKSIELILIAAQAMNRSFILNDHDQALWVHWKDLGKVGFLTGNKKFFPSIENFFKKN